MSADDNTKHCHKFTQTCDQHNCFEKKCDNLCDNLKTVYSDGFFTHGPVAGKFSKFVSPTDTHGKENSQYFTSNNDKTKQIDGNTFINFVKNKEIKSVPKFDAYSKQSEISDKFNE